MDYLYRGINSKMHSLKLGLKPKETSLKRQLQSGQRHASHGNGVVHGTSRRNGIIGHQLDSSICPTSAISTSLNFDVAKNYATHGGQKEGFVYKIDCKRLAKYNIEKIIVSDVIKKPFKPEDKEVLLREKSNGTIPFNIVAEVIKIK